MVRTAPTEETIPATAMTAGGMTGTTVTGGRRSGARRSVPALYPASCLGRRHR